MPTKKRVSPERTYLYIDGTNLFAGLVELFGPDKIPQFVTILKDIEALVKPQKVYFYASYMVGANYNRRPELRKLAGTEGHFYSEVKKTKNLTFYKGSRSPTSGKEKGVDVHLAVDIVRDVFLKKCKNVIIMTGDADLVYPLEIAKQFGAKVQAIFLPNRFSLGITVESDKATILNYLGKFAFRSGGRIPRKLEVLAIKRPRVHAPGVG